MTTRSSQALLLIPLLTANLSVALAGSRAQGLLANTALIAAGAAAIALPVGGLLALLVYKSRLPGRTAVAVGLLTMLFLPLHLHAAAWRAGFGGLGWFTQAAAGEGPIDPLLTGAAGAVWVHGVAAVAWVALVVGAALRSVDARLEEHARLNLPASQVLLRISLRTAAPAFLVAAGWVLVTVAHEMSVSDLFQVRTFAEEVYTLSALGLFDPAAGDVPKEGMRVLQLVCGLTAVGGVAVAVLWGARTYLCPPTTGRQALEWLWSPRGGKPLATGLMWLLLFLAAGVPLGNLIYKMGGSAVRDGDTWRREWSATKVVTELAAAPVNHRRELFQSAKLGAAVATVAVFVGGAVAWRLRRGGAERLAWLACIAICLTIPGPLIGLAAIRLFNHPLNSFLWPLSWLYDNTLLVPWLVQMIRAAPIAALVLWPVWQGLPRSVLDAARLDAAPRWWVAARARASEVVAAWLIALAVSFGELSATLLVMPPGDTTITLQLFNLLHSGVDDRVAAISLWMVALMGGAAWAVLRLWASAGPGETR